MLVNKSWSGAGKKENEIATGEGLNSVVCRIGSVS